MELVWMWSPWWYFGIAIGFFVWLPLFLQRKSWKRKGEITEQIFFGFFSLGVSFIHEMVAISNNLWHYSGGDWPVILWVAYFLVGAAGFQFIKFVDERWKR
jgi:hypothetical protein